MLIDTFKKCISRTPFIFDKIASHDAWTLLLTIKKRIVESYSSYFRASS